MQRISTEGNLHIDIASDQEFVDLAEKIRPYTITSVERQYCLYKAMKYILDNGLSGDLVECGVWKGGSAAYMLRMLQKRGIRKEVWLYDTYEGMTQHGEVDKPVSGVGAEHFSGKVLAVSIGEVVENLKACGVSKEYIDMCRFVKGDVLDTLEREASYKIALLRLDTDFYESTKKELQILYPRVVRGGIVIFDDYGHWLGSKKAIDEYFEMTAFNIKPMLFRLDYSGAACVKSF